MKNHNLLIKLKKIGDGYYNEINFIIQHCITTNVFVLRREEINFLKDEALKTIESLPKILQFSFSTLQQCINYIKTEMDNISITDDDIKISFYDCDIDKQKLHLKIDKGSKTKDKLNIIYNVMDILTQFFDKDGSLSKILSIIDDLDGERNNKFFCIPIPIKY